MQGDFKNVIKRVEAAQERSTKTVKCKKRRVHELRVKVIVLAHWRNVCFYISCCAGRNLCF